MINVSGIEQSVVAFVFARGGSKGVVGKNIRSLAGKPLISYSITCALSSPYVDRVIVSTDDHEIALIAEQYGAEVPFMRPAELATDQSAEWFSWQHALNFLKDAGEMPDIFLSVPSTSPLRDVDDLNATIERLSVGQFDVVLTVSEAARNPYFNMVKINEPDGGVDLAVRPDRPITRRQDAPVFYDITTVAYAARPGFILQNNGVFQGKVGIVVIPCERAMDIDTEHDFKVAEFLMREKQKGLKNA